jgi:hypothetical protein
MNTHSYEYIHIHYISMNTFEKLSRIYLKIYKVDHQEHLVKGRHILLKK